jgi:hypothetical protein
MSLIKMEALPSPEEAEQELKKNTRFSAATNAAKDNLGWNKTKAILENLRRRRNI